MLKGEVVMPGAMDFRNCPVCGKVFRFVSRNLCPDCIAEEEKEYEKVRSYVRDHEGANITEVSEATGVSVEKIIRFLREGRLVAKGALAGEGAITCERCGVPIGGGQFCDRCREELAQELQRRISPAASSSTRPAAPPKTRGEEKMYTADLHKAPPKRRL